MLRAPGELDDHRGAGRSVEIVLVSWVIPAQFGIFLGHALDEQVPQIVVEKIALRVRVQPGLAHARQDGVLLEPGPQHGEVVDLGKGPDVETLHALGFVRALEIVDDLTLSRGRAGDEKDDVEGWGVHGVS